MEGNIAHTRKGKRGFAQRLVVNTPLWRSNMARVQRSPGTSQFCLHSAHPAFIRPLTEWTIPAFSPGPHLPTPEGWKANLVA